MEHDLNQYIVREYGRLETEREQREFVEKIRFLMMAGEREFSAYYSKGILTGREFYSVADALYALNNFWMLSGFVYQNRQHLFREVKGQMEPQETRNFLEPCKFGKDTILSRMFQVMRSSGMDGSMVNECDDYHVITRRIKVYGATGSRGATVPQIVLQGNWVEQWGFEPGCSVRVECYRKKLVILKE